MGILVFNAGSSSLKFAFFNGNSSKPKVAGSIELKAGRLNHKNAAARVLERLGNETINVMAHRVVHGGAEFSEPVRLDAPVLKKLQALNELAPLHNPLAIEVIDLTSTEMPEAEQFAVFDTAFFSTLPERSLVFPLPYEWFENRGIRRYGFHGINHQYCSEQSQALGFLPEKDPRLIVCHLGNGCSVSAIRDGKPVATSMGFTPLDGVVMGTRPGAVDPGILLHLLKLDQFSIDELEDLINRNSGLLGISGVSSDVRDLTIAVDSGNCRAALALQIFADSVRSFVAAYAAQMGGLEGLVFTGGIGEHSAQARELICEGLEIIGCRLCSESNLINAETDRRISAKSSSVEMWVVQANEELSIARQARDLASKNSHRH